MPEALNSSLEVNIVFKYPQNLPPLSTIPFSVYVATVAIGNQVSTT